MLSRPRFAPGPAARSCRVRPAALLAALLASAALCGCADPADLLQYEDRRRFEPPRETYAQWWREVEACSGRTGDLSGIRWFLAELIGWGWGRPSPTVRGQWLSNREITLKAGHEWEYHVVKHEMLHDLLRGDGEHTDPTWGVCDRHDGMPGEPGLSTGTYDVEVSWRAPLSERSFAGTLTVHAVDEERVEVSWDVVSTVARDPSRFASAPVAGMWEYVAYRVRARVQGPYEYSVVFRIARVDGEVRCLGAEAAGRTAACMVRGPR